MVWAEQQAASLQALLTTWRVLPEGVRVLRAVHARALNQAVAARCLALARDAVPPELGERVGDSDWTTPELAFAHYVALARDAEAAVLPAISALLAVCGSTPGPVDFRGVGDGREWKLHCLSTLAGDYERDGRAAELHPAEPAAADVDACLTAHEILRTSWPEMASAIDALVREIVWFERTAGASSGTVIPAYGAIFLARGQSVAHALTALVHETTHLEVIARLAVDETLVNLRDHDVSPFRTRSRPLSRVLHAAVVAVRCVEAVDRAIDALPAGERDAAAAERRRLAASLDTAVESLQRSGRWTELGAGLFEDLVARRAELQR